MNTLLTVFNAFPAILQTVLAVEAAIPMSNAGQQKMNMILGAATTAWEVGAIAEQITQANWLSAVEAMTNVAVAGLNAAGVFGTTPTTVTATGSSGSVTTAPAATL